MLLGCLKIIFCDEMIEVLKNDIKEGNLEESEEVK